MTRKLLPCVWRTGIPRWLRLEGPRYIDEDLVLPLCHSWSYMQKRGAYFKVLIDLLGVGNVRLKWVSWCILVFHTEWLATSLSVLIFRTWGSTGHLQCFPFSAWIFIFSVNSYVSVKVICSVEGNLSKTYTWCCLTRPSLFLLGQV